MGKGNTPRFTSRVPRDISRIKARFQKKQNSAKNKGWDRFSRKVDKNREINDFNWIQYILLLIN